MKGARATMKNSLVLSLSVLLIFGFVFLTSCKGKPGAGEAGKEGEQTAEQAKIEELQRELNAKNDLIKQLQRENADLQSKVPTPWEVQEGDNHWKIAYSYLTDKKGLSDEEAKKILKNAYLFDTLLAGFQVGNVSDSEGYSGFISQGDAVASPGKMKRVEDTKKEAEKVVLRNTVTLAEVDTMKLDANMKDKMMMVKKEMEALQKTNAWNEERAEKYKNIATDFESKLNSVYYYAATRDGLKASGKTDLGSMVYNDFQNRVDLRENDVIGLRAGDFNIPAIKKVEIVPKTLREGLDYRVEISADGQSASVYLLKKDKFRLARIIIAVS